MVNVLRCIACERGIRVCVYSRRKSKTTKVKSKGVCLFDPKSFSMEGLRVEGGKEVRSKTGQDEVRNGSEEGEGRGGRWALSGRYRVWIHYGSIVWGLYIVLHSTVSWDDAKSEPSGFIGRDIKVYSQ